MFRSALRLPPLPLVTCGRINAVASVIWNPPAAEKLIDPPVGFVSVNQLTPSFEPSQMMVLPTNVPITWNERSARSGRWIAWPTSPVEAKPAQVTTTASIPPPGPRILAKVGVIVAIIHASQNKRRHPDRRPARETATAR